MCPVFFGECWWCEQRKGFKNWMSGNLCAGMIELLLWTLKIRMFQYKNLLCFWILSLLKKIPSIVTLVMAYHRFMNKILLGFSMENSYCYAIFICIIFSWWHIFANDSHASSLPALPRWSISTFFCSNLKQIKNAVLHSAAYTVSMWATWLLLFTIEDFHLVTP